MNKNKNKIKKASVLVILAIFVMSTLATSINSQELVINSGKQKEIKNEALIKKINYLNIFPLFSDPWWDSEWTYRKKITIDYNEIDGNLNNFPVLISVTDSDIASKAQTDGDDIVFTDDDATQLDHEIEYYEYSTGDLICWVNIPSLSSTENTIIYMYYGNNDCGNQENINDVWDSNFIIIQHLEEISGTHFDSTSNGNDGSPNGGLDQDAIGMVDGADNFDGINDYVFISEDPSFDFSPGSVTFESWINTNDHTVDQVVIQHERSKIRVWDNTIKSTWMDFEHVDSGVIPTDGQWYYVVVTFDGTNQRIYVDGVLEATTSHGYEDTTNFNMTITHPETQWFNGTLDEVRVSNIARSSDWVSTTYNTIKNPDEFFNLGSEEIYELNYAPVISIPNPSNETTNVPVDLDELTVTIEDLEGDMFDWTIDTSPDIGSASGYGESNGTKYCDVTDLDYETTYTWTVTATDIGSGETTTEFYIFTTIDSDPPEFFDPDPDDGATEVPISLDELSVTIEDPEGDLFDWTIDTSPDIGSASGYGESNGTKYCDVSGLDYDITYTWTVTATDPDGSGETRVESYTFTTEEYNDPPNTPSKPTGPTDLMVGEYAEFCTHSTDPNDDQIQYRFDWGDGTYSEWSSLTDSGETVCMENAWGLAGTYEVRAQARDEHGAYSDWSNHLYVDVTGENDPPSKPNKPTGPRELLVGEIGEYCTSATDPDGHQVQYKFDWGDGTYSEWTYLVPSGTIACMSHDWKSPGTYEVKAIARDELTALSEQWSDEIIVTINPTEEDLSCDGKLNWPGVKTGITVTGTFTIKNIGDPYSKLDWEISDWPDWGEWFFSPAEGYDLNPEDGDISIQVSVIVPDEKDTTFTGDVKIENKENSNDFCTIDVILTTPKTKYSFNSIRSIFFNQIFRHYPLLERIFTSLPFFYLLFKNVKNTFTVVNLLTEVLD